MPKYIVKHTYLAPITEEYIFDVPDTLPDGEGIEWLFDYPWDWMQHHPELVESRGYRKANEQASAEIAGGDEHFGFELMTALDQIVNALIEDD